MTTKFGKDILNALYEEGTHFDPKMEIVFERFPSDKETVLQTAHLFVSFKTLKAGGIGRVYFKEVGAFSDLWAMWDEKTQQIVLFIFAGCVRVPMVPVRYYTVLNPNDDGFDDDEDLCCGNFFDDDIV